MMPMANSSKGEMPGQRLQRLGGVGGGLDVGDAGLVQGRGGGDHDRQRDQVGDQHAGDGVDADARTAPPGASRGRVQQRLFVGAAGPLPPLPGRSARRTDRG